MKKIIVAAAALFLFAGISNAQTATKTPPAKPVHHAIAKKTDAAAGAATSNVTPATDATKTAATSIKRKHHAKKATPKKSAAK